MSAPATPDSSQPASTVPRPSVPELFLAFARVSLMSFGGVLAWSRRMLVEEKRWMAPAEFNELLALSQILPGPNIVNVSAVFGYRLHRLPGALACLLGLLAPSVTLMIIAGTLYRQFGVLPGLRGVLAGFAAAAGGMIVATALRISEPLWRGRKVGPEHAVAVAAFVAVGVLRVSLPIVLVVLVPVSIALAWRQQAGERP